MNLSPEWAPLLRENGFEAGHWSVIGAYNAPDRDIMQWARDNGWVVFTHDLDFGILLAHTRDGSPSVIQVRTQDVSPDHLGPIVLRALRAHREALESGALLTIDESKSRVRILPI
jgi:predicted nuclease of predicted toxin-antitoxin system